MTLWADIERGIAATAGAAFSIEDRSSVSGGCINSAWLISGDGHRYFVNHLNLFGGSYLRQAERMIDALLAEIKA
jgi:fructosamine-3-kinase